MYSPLIMSTPLYIQEHTAEEQARCLKLCREYPGATGCEFSRGCFVHTQDVAKGNGMTEFFCWIFAECKAGTLKFCVNCLNFLWEQLWRPMRPSSRAVTSVTDGLKNSWKYSWNIMKLRKRILLSFNSSNYRNPRNHKNHRNPRNYSISNLAIRFALRYKLQITEWSSCSM